MEDFAAAETADFTIPPPVTSLTGSFVTSVDPALGVSSSNPATFTLGLTAANQWSTRLVASADAPVNGQLADKAKLAITLGNGAAVAIEVAADATNTSLDDLVSDINAAIGGTRLAGNVRALRQSGRIAFEALGAFALSVDAPAGELGDTALHLRGLNAPAAILSTLNSVFQEKLLPLVGFKTEDFIAGVQDLVKLFDDNYLRHLTTDIPLLNQSLDDVLGVSRNSKMRSPRFRVKPARL